MKNPFKSLFGNKEPPNFVDPPRNNIFSATPIFDAAKAHNDMADALRAGLVTPEEYKKRVLGEPSCLAKLNQQNSSGAVDEIEREKHLVQEIKHQKELAYLKNKLASSQLSQIQMNSASVSAFALGAGNSGNLPWNNECVVLQVETARALNPALDHSIDVSVKMRMSERAFNEIFTSSRSTKDKMDMLLNILKKKQK